MANKERIIILLQDFADGVISKSDYMELVGYFNLQGNDQEIYAAMDQIWQQMDTESWHTEEEVNQIYLGLIDQITTKTKHKVIPLRKLSYRIAAAAVLLISVGIGYSLYHSREMTPASARFAAHDIAPGGNRAVLTLANGKTINLNDSGNGELANEAGISVTKTNTGQLVYTAGTLQKGMSVTDEKARNTISTPRGGQYQVNLPDGTRVWLNAASSIQFPLHFNSRERKVSLHGEAYFEVAKLNSMLKGKPSAARIPFIVETDRQELRVLGTHFNINAYDAVTKTTLLEGAVTVSALPDAKNPVPILSYLRPGQQSVLRNGAIRVGTADTEEAMAWKNGIFLFSGQDLEGIMQEVERWYDVDVVFEENSLKSQTFGGTISRFKNISQLLEVLESTGSVHFKMQGRRITVMK